MFDSQDSTSPLVEGWDPLGSSGRAEDARGLAKEVFGFDPGAFADHHKKKEEEEGVSGSEDQEGAIDEVRLNLSFHLGDRTLSARSKQDEWTKLRDAETVLLNSSVAVWFPKPGEMVNRFRILSELGRGAFARVYLAQEVDLADRPVALKVSQACGEESQNLARLQHTHIVPIHSVHNDEKTNLQLICMPYVGGANLAQILSSSAARLTLDATGGSLVEALDRVGFGADTRSVELFDAGWASQSNPYFVGQGCAAAAGRDSPSVVRSKWGRYFARLNWWPELEGTSRSARLEPGKGLELEPARRFLRGATYVQASMWIAARLAEALEHAHERGILHRDLKPSNVLIAADGTPMLLDFNLAVRPTFQGTEAQRRAALGGTLPYMAPEHLAAMHPVRPGPAENVGPAADVYALGLILFEMVTGHHAFDDPSPSARLSETIESMVERRMQGAPSARKTNPGVSWGLDSVIRKSLEPDLSKRYADATSLGEDLRRLLDDLPLLHAREPSLREQVGKWSRRHPRTCSATGIGTVALVLMLLLTLIGLGLRQRLDRSDSLVAFQELQERHKYAQLWLNTAGPSAHTERGIQEAGQALGLYGVGVDPNWLDRSRLKLLGEPDREKVLEQLSELVQLRARARVRQAQEAGEESERRNVLVEAVAWLNLAERIDPKPSYSLFEDRAHYLSALGEAELAARDRLRCDSSPPKSARDHALRGTSLLAEGRIDAAEPWLSRATSLDPNHFWSWFGLGLCHHEQGRYEQAANDFAMATVLAPEFAWPHVNRGLCLAAAGRLREARACYDRALWLSPSFYEGRVNRALTRLELGDAAGALEDLNEAVVIGPVTGLILSARAEALGRLGRKEDAGRDHDRAVALRPRDPLPRVARGYFEMEASPAKARADFEKALELDARNGRARLGLAKLVWRTDLGEAIRQLNACLEVEPELYDAIELRALVLGRMGDEACQEDVKRLLTAPTPHRLYNAACALALFAEARGGEARSAHESLALLGRSVDAGFPISEAREDEDLRVLRGCPEFKALMESRQGRGIR